MSQALNNNDADIWQAIVRQKMVGLRFGSIEIVVHEGRATLMHTTEKIRLNASPVNATGGKPGLYKF